MLGRTTTARYAMIMLLGLIVAGGLRIFGQRTAACWLAIVAVGLFLLHYVVAVAFRTSQRKHLP